MLAGLMLGIIGCGKKGTITLRYDRPAVYEIPSDVRKIAIVPFGAKSDTEQKWGDIASDKLASELDEVSKKYARYQLVDRKRVSAIMAERDFQQSIVDTDEAVKFGRIAKVDAMIYGTVYVSEEVQKKEVTVPTPYGSAKIPSTTYLSTAAINFSMVDVQTSRTIASVTVTRKYDSKNKEDKDFYKRYKNNLTAITIRLVEECCEEFVGKISAHQIVVNEKIYGTKSKPAQQGNEFALAGEYADAIRMYETGLQEKSDDWEAMFNMGVCYEAMGQLADAEHWYDKALQYEVKQEIIQARKRVRQENGG